MLKVVILATLSIAPESTVNSSGTLLIDWIQVVIELFVTFFGVGLAILGERMTDWFKNRKDTRELKKLVKEELKKVYNELENFSEETLDVQPLKIPLWESAVNTGQVSLFDFATRNKLFHVYNTINEFNSWCKIHTNYYFEKEKQNRLLIKTLNQMKNELLSNNLNESDSSINSAIEILEEGRISNAN